MPVEDENSRLTRDQLMSEDTVPLSTKDEKPQPVESHMAAEESVPLSAKEESSQLIEDQLVSEDTIPQRALEDAASQEAFPAVARQPADKDSTTVTRRSFAAGLVGLAAVCGGGGWYLLEQRLSVPQAPTTGLNNSQPATRTTIDHTNVLIFTGHLASVNAVSWSPDGKLIASAGADQTVQISHGSDGVSSPPPFTGPRNQSSVNPVLSVAWSPDGRSIASGDAAGNVYVWRVADRKTLFVYSGHKGAANALAWSPNGKLIASAGVDTTVQVWQPA